MFISLFFFVSGCNITGNNNIESIKPHIIVFDDDSIDDVKEKFRELIEEYNIPNDKIN